MRDTTSNKKSLQVGHTKKVKADNKRCKVTFDVQIAIEIKQLASTTGNSVSEIMRKAIFQAISKDEDNAS